MNNEEMSPNPQLPVGTLQRRKYHITAAQWLAKWSYRLQIMFALIGFFVVLLPALNKSWRKIVEAFPPTEWIFHDFSTLSGWALLLFGGLMAGYLFLNFRVKDYPGGWNPTKEGRFPYPEETFEKELYPRNKKEEFVFWVNIFVGTVGTTFWLYLPFGVLAFFIRLKTGV